MVDRYVEGVSFGSCNCDYGCPCQFERRPTRGDCRGFEVLRIDRGHFGDVRLEGLRAAGARTPLVHAQPPHPPQTPDLDARAASTAAR
jgi:hypothetical protein